MYSLYLKNCERQLQRNINITLHFKKKGTDVVGLSDAGDCQLDGHFAPRQCQSSVCYCVDPDGAIIKSYSSDSSSEMNCQCARREHNIDTNSQISYDKLLCTSNGNFRSFQQFQGDSVAFCVDEDGSRISNFLRGDQTHLRLLPQDLANSANFDAICNQMRDCLNNKGECLSPS